MMAKRQRGSAFWAFLLGVAVGVVPVVLGWLLLLQRAPVYPGALAAAAGLLALLLLITVLLAHRRALRGLHAVDEARAVLAESEARFRALADIAAGVMVLHGTRIILANQGISRMTGYSQDELLGMEQLDLVHPDDRVRLLDNSLRRQRGEPAPSRYEARLLTREGETRWVEITAQRTVFNGESCSIGMLYDITERKRIEQELRASEQRHRLLADNASDVIWTMDLDGHFTYVSPSIEKLRGYSAEEVMQQTLEQALTPTSAGRARDGLARAIASVLSGYPMETFRAELEQLRRDGSTVWTEVSASGIYDAAGHFVGVLGVTRDISDRKRAEARIEFLAHHDPLTGLPNRALLRDRISQSLMLAERSEQPVAVIFLDLDRFKPVNDTWGHATGDQLLQLVAQRIHDCLRASDTVARIGGDEFVVLLPQIDSEQHAVQVAEKIRDALNRPFDLGHAVAHISSSLGVAMYPQHGSDESVLARHADLAMYQAKANGRDRVVVFESSMGLPAASAVR